MEEMLQILIKQLKLELEKSYQSRAYNPQRNTPGAPKRGNGTKIDTGKLRDSIRYEIKEDLDTGEFNGVIIMEDYYEFVDRGRRPGYDGPLESRVFRRALDEWTQRRIGRFPGMTFSQTAYLVRRSVLMKGIGGTNFINNAIDNILNDMINKGEEEFAKQFEDFVDNKLLVLSNRSFNLTYNA